MAVMIEYIDILIEHKKNKTAKRFGMTREEFDRFMGYTEHDSLSLDDDDEPFDLDKFQ